MSQNPLRETSVTFEISTDWKKNVLNRSRPVVQSSITINQNRRIVSAAFVFNNSYVGGSEFNCLEMIISLWAAVKASYICWDLGVDTMEKRM